MRWDDDAGNDRHRHPGRGDRGRRRVSPAGDRPPGRGGGSPHGIGFGFVARRAAPQVRRRADIPRLNSTPGPDGARAISVRLLRRASPGHTPVGGSFTLEDRLRPAYGPGRLYRWRTRACRNCGPGASGPARRLVSFGPFRASLQPRRLPSRRRGLPRQHGRPRHAGHPAQDLPGSLLSPPFRPKPSASSRSGHETYPTA